MAKHTIDVRMRTLVRLGDRLVNPLHVVSIQEVRGVSASYDLVRMVDDSSFEAKAGAGGILEVPLGEMPGETALERFAEVETRMEIIDRRHGDLAVRLEALRSGAAATLRDAPDE